MQINFYVLQSKASNDANDSAKRLLNFVCRLTQTVLAKSSHSLLIVDDDTNRLAQLDEWLWMFDPTSFVPHERITFDDVAASRAPVLLIDAMPTEFDGVVLNLSAKPIAINNMHILPDKILEIIGFDEASKQQGREKYKHYQTLGIRPNYHQV